MKKPRLILIITSIVCTALLTLISQDFLRRAFETLQTLPSGWWGYIALAVAIQVSGHWLRMLRTKTVIDQVKKGGVRGQFGALAIGYLFNTLLPLRGGELVRAIIIAMRLHMSFVYTLAVIVLERVIDLLLIGLLVIGVSFFFSGEIALLLLLAAIGAIAAAIFIISMLVLLMRENRTLLALVWHITGWFNNHLRNQLRFKVWSLIFGLQRFLRHRSAVRRYAALTIASWACYIVSMAVIALIVLPGIQPLHTFLTASAPYIAVSAPSDPGYITNYEQFIRPVVSLGVGDAVAVTMYIILSWLVLTVPMFALGFIALFVLKFSFNKRERPAGREGFSNKLMRQHDLSQEFPAFLDTYFSGHHLSRILHKLELSGDVNLVRFFKGGSDAITVLVLSDGKLIVKKIIPLEYEDRLKAQYDWLKDHKKLPHLVEVLCEQRSSNYYAIDLAYDEENIPFFEYIHHHSLKESQAVLEEVWSSLYEHLHARSDKLQTYPEHRKRYIDKHIFGCADKAAAIHPELRRALEPARITINGIEYDNLHTIMAKIKKHKQAWKDIATYHRSGVVHGDPSIDNIMVSTRTKVPLIIDPAPDGNVIEGPVFDMGKMMQSFYCGYEFSFRDEEPVYLGADDSIHYRDHRSERYTQLCNFIQKDLAPKYLSKAEQKAIVFHAAALHIRRLKHQAHFNPENTLKFYAVGVKTLNEFLALYE